MTEAGPAPASAFRGSTFGLRLALAFLSVALAAVALLAGLTATLAAADVSDLTSQQRTDLTGAIAAAAAAAWDRGDSWASADLSPVLDLATRTGAEAQIRDQSGHRVTGLRLPGQGAGAEGTGNDQRRTGRAGRGPVHQLRAGQRRPRAPDRPAAGHLRRCRAGRGAGPAHRAGHGPADHPAGGTDHRGDPGHGAR